MVKTTNTHIENALSLLSATAHPLKPVKQFQKGIYLISLFQGQNMTAIHCYYCIVLYERPRY